VLFQKCICSCNFRCRWITPASPDIFTLIEESRASICLANLERQFLRVKAPTSPVTAQIDADATPTCCPRSAPAHVISAAARLRLHRPISSLSSRKVCSHWRRSKVGSAISLEKLHVGHFLSVEAALTACMHAAMSDTIH